MKAPPSPRDAGGVYDAIYRRSPLRDQPRFYSWILKRASANARERILDIGCGAGDLLHAAAAAGIEAWGVDISREALRQAQGAVPRARLALADGARLPFPAACFRHVFNLGNLEHFTDLEGGIREMRRVLAPEGTAWVLLPNLYYSGAIWRALTGGSGPDHHQPIDRFATRGEWRELLEAGGLCVIGSAPYHKGKWWKRCLPPALAWHFLYEARRGEPSGRVPLPPLGRVRPRME